MKKTKHPAHTNTRAAAEPELNYRTLSLRAAADGTPATLDEKTRSVEVIGATEERVRVFDFQRFEPIDEILLMSGLKMPSSRQVVMLDNHQRYDTASVIGSYRDMRVEGNKLIGRAHYSTVTEAEGPYTKMREGHLTDYSAGYQVLKSEWVPEKETRTIQGKDYPGPVSVVTAWKIRELSNCPIGADEIAKTRSRPADNDNHNNHQPKRPQPAAKEITMNEKLRKLLEARGLSPEASEAEAWADYEALDTATRAEITNQLAAIPAADPDPDPLPAATPDGARSDFNDVLAAERTRAAEIRALGRRHDCLDEVEKFIDDGSTPDQARAAVLDIVAQRAAAEPPAGAGFAPPRLIADARDKFRAAADDAICLRAGLDIEKPAAGHDELTGYSLVEMARESLRMANQRTSGNVMEMVGRALTTSDFPYILANTANKSLFAGYNTADETWSKVFGTGSVSDFKTHTTVRASEASDLEEVDEEQEYKYGKRTEGKEEYSIATYGKLYAISRQAIINDDLNALSDQPRAHGEAAARKIGDVAYAVLTANAAMGDGVALFHANHANLISSGGAVSTTQLAAMIKAMKMQKDLQGLRRLNIRPQFFLAPVSLEGAAEQFFTTTIDPGKSIAGVNNPYAGSYFTRVYEPRLDDDSATVYYLLGAKNKTVKVFFLGGQQKPYMETKKGWSVDGVEYKVRIDAGAKAMDWKALVKNPGA